MVERYFGIPSTNGFDMDTGSVLCLNMTAGTFEDTCSLDWTPGFDTGSTIAVTLLATSLVAWRMLKRMDPGWGKEPGLETSEDPS